MRDRTYVGVSHVQLWPRMRSSSIHDTARLVTDAVSPGAAYSLLEPENLVTSDTWVVLAGTDVFAGLVVEVRAGQWYVAGSLPPMPVRLMDVSGRCVPIVGAGETYSSLEDLRSLSLAGLDAWVAANPAHLDQRSLDQARAEISAVGIRRAAERRRTRS